MKLLLILELVGNLFHWAGQIGICPAFGGMENLAAHLQTLTAGLEPITGRGPLDGLLRLGEKFVQPIVTGLEWHLGSRPQVDVSLHVTPDDPLCLQLAANPPGPGPVWAWVSRLCHKWPEKLRHIFLEFDQPDGSTQPSVLLYRKKTKSDCLPVDFASLADLVPAEVVPPEAFQRALAALEGTPPEFQLTCLGVWTGRSDPRIRVAFLPRAPQVIRDYLGPAHNPFVDLAERLSAGNHLSIARDAGGRERLGLMISPLPDQLFQPGSRWFVPVLDQLISEQLCTPEQRDLLLNWSGRVGNSLKRLAYFKVTFDEQRALSAKVYFGTAQIVPGLLGKLVH